MSTYPIEKVLFEYEHNRMDVEMAMGHSLQHIAHLSATQATTVAEQQVLRQKIGTLENLLHSVQSKLDRLVAQAPPKVAP